MLWFPSFPFGVFSGSCLAPPLPSLAPQMLASSGLSPRPTSPLTSSPVLWPQLPSSSHPPKAVSSNPNLSPEIQTPVSESSLDVVETLWVHCLGLNLPSCPTCLLASIPLPQKTIMCIIAGAWPTLTKCLLSAHAVLCQGISSSGHQQGRLFPLPHERLN